MDNHVGATKEQVTVRAEEEEAVRGLLKRAKLADISLDVLQVKLLSLGFPCWGTPFYRENWKKRRPAKMSR